MINNANIATAQSVANLGKDCINLTSYLPKSYTAIGRECTEIILKQISQDNAIPYEDSLCIASQIPQLIKHSKNQKSILEVANKYLSTQDIAVQQTIDDDWFGYFLEER